MIINLLKSKIFTDDPDVRFAKEYGVPQGVWKEILRRYKIMDYSPKDLRDYLFIKHARNLEYTTLARWIVRSEIYTLTKPVLDKGGRTVVSSFFGEHEEYIMNELTKQLKNGASKTSRSII
jgi:hypothetical protein